LLQNLIS